MESLTDMMSPKIHDDEGTRGCDTEGWVGQHCSD